MKIGKLLLTGVIALGLMACNNEEGPDLSAGKDATITIKVLPSSTSPGVRATGDLSGTGVSTAGLAAESAIKTLEAWVFVGDNLETYKTVTITSDLEIKDIKVTSGPRKVVVAANAGIGTKATWTALSTAVKDLSQTITNGLPMTAEPFSATLVAGKNYYGYTGTTGTGHNYIKETPLALTRTNARVAIVGATLQLPTLEPGEVQLFDALTNVQVAMFNVPKKSSLFGTSLAINNNYLFGSAWPSSQSSYTVGTVESTLTDGSVAFPIANTAAAPAAYYYVNENVSTVTKERTFIVLRGKPTLNGTAVSAPGLYTDADGYTYYPVWVNASDKGYTYNRPDLVGYLGNNLIQRNFQYNISLTITGIGNPTIDPAEDAWLDVKVSVAPWEVVNQNVTW